MSDFRPGRFAGPACLLFFVLNATEVRAQGTRDQRIAAADAAWGNLDYARAQNLLVMALDPRAGPVDSTWAKGVQLLGQVLLDLNRPALAGIWLRWGFRLNADLPIDSLTFTPELVSAAIAARSAVSTGSRGDSVTRTSWDWPGAATTDSMGRIRVGLTSLTSPVRVLVQGPRVTMGANTGESLTLPAGTYEIQAAADGYFTARVSREILPGVTTVLSFDLMPVAVVVAPRDTVRADTVAPAVVATPAAVPAAVEPPPPPVAAPEVIPKPADEPPKTVAPPLVTRKGKSKLPFILAGGAAGAGAAVYFLFIKPDPTGDVEVSVPVVVP